jgi:hypothetical protein
LPKPNEQPLITQKPPLPNREQTQLTPLEEVIFRQWAIANKLDKEVDNPEAFYDYKGYWKATSGAPHSPAAQDHFPDTFKMHGHPTFSVESRYSNGPADGGIWIGPQHDIYLPQPPMASSHTMTPPEATPSPIANSISPMASHEPSMPTPIEQALTDRIQ